MKRTRLRRACTVLATAVFLAIFAPHARAADLDDAQKLFNTGKYEDCIDACRTAMIDNEAAAGLPLPEAWWVLKTKAQLAIGKYPEALRTVIAGVDAYESSAQLRLLGYDALRFNDRPDDALKALLAIRDMAEDTPWRFQDAASRVTLGRAFLRGGADARKVLELYYDKAKKDSPNDPDAYIASGELALMKEDFALAAEQYKEAAKRSPDDPDIYYGLARAYANDEEQATAALAQALALNPRHVESLLLRVDNLIDSESYKDATTLLDTVLQINPKYPRAWAYRAVIAHLTGNPKDEAAARAQALDTWSTNPEVDYLIGHKLSQNYRFTEGSAYQQKSLAFDADYNAARVQLSQDLLRLGREDEGWKLANLAFKEDPYNVLAYNLTTLHDSLTKYATIQNDQFIIRMDKTEAAVYGQRVLKLLTRARQKLSAKYDVQLTQPTTVELFAQQKDFAIGTFGMPGGGDFLGVCFGPVVTLNSPASRGANPSNWEATLWHEFCHTITLTKTHNKMPRWLSEGISVYEERQENGSWGQAMTPEYRTMILGNEAAPGGALADLRPSELTPVSKLSTAFMSPKSPAHLMFAYYESSMVIDYLNKTYGPEAVRWILTDLGNDIPINEAISRHTEPIDKVDTHFETWIKEQARQLAPKVDWEKPSLPPAAGLDPAAQLAAVTQWNTAHPNSFAGLMAQGEMLLTARQFQDAIAPLQKAAALFPNYVDPDGPLPMLASAYRELNQPAKEKEALDKFVALNPDAIAARLRLMELAATGAASETKTPDWRETLTQADRALAITPMLPAPYRRLAQSAEALNERPIAIDAYRTLLQLDPLDRVEQHFRLAKLLAAEKQLPDARYEVVRALEDAPRYRAALSLLADIAAQMDAATLPAPPGGTP